MIDRDDILAEIDYGLDDMLAGAPETMSEATRKNIKDEFSQYTQMVLDALSTEELQSGNACAGS